MDVNEHERLSNFTDTNLSKITVLLLLLNFFTAMSLQYTCTSIRTYLCYRGIIKINPRIKFCMVNNGGIMFTIVTDNSRQLQFWKFRRIFTYNRMEHLKNKTIVILINVPLLFITWGAFSNKMAIFTMVLPDATLEMSMKENPSKKLIQNV